MKMILYRILLILLFVFGFIVIIPTIVVTPIWWIITGEDLLGDTIMWVDKLKNKLKTKFGIPLTWWDKL